MTCLQCNKYILCSAFNLCPRPANSSLFVDCNEILWMKFKDEKLTRWEHDILRDNEHVILHSCYVCCTEMTTLTIVSYQRSSEFHSFDPSWVRDSHNSWTFCILRNNVCRVVKRDIWFVMSRLPAPAVKVKLSISVKISNCSYSETRFSLTKNTQIHRESRMEKKHKNYFFKIFLWGIEYFL
jgi:hypothetical protein